jgi:hypothetical protein
MATILTKTTSDGRTAELAIVIYPGDIAYVRVNINGQQYIAAGQLEQLPEPRGTATHAIRGVGKALGLSDAEARQVQAAIRHHEVATPTALRNQRNRLVATLNGLHDGIHARRELAIDAGLDNLPDYDNAATRAAEQAIADFDATHPEVKAAIRSERDAMVDRHFND